jgi:hypothetical protein
MTQLVLDTYGRECWLKLKGCTGVATTKDHVVPYSHGGDDSLENFRPACRSCNSKRQNMAVQGYGASVVVVIGPPAAGKTTYVREHARPEDIVIDLDEIARALMPAPPEQTHTYPAHTRHVAIKARGAAIAAARRLRERVTVWIIQAVPRPDDLADYRRLGYQVITIDPGRAIVEDRARRLRPEFMRPHVARYYATYGEQSTEPARPMPEAVAATTSEPDW